MAMNQTTYAPATTGRPRRRFTSALLALAVLVGTITVTARPAHAASYVFGCFRMANGGILNGYPVELRALVDNQWLYVTSTTLGNTPYGNSCAGFPIPTGYARSLRFALMVNFTAGGARFAGRSYFDALPGDLVAHVGTGTVTCFGCAY
jgi:hypothetical protein